MSPRPDRLGDRHGWADLQTHLRVHRRYLDDLRNDFVVSDDLGYRFITPALFEIRGRVACRHGVFVDVRKTLEIDDRGRARTIQYSYHAGLAGPIDRPILRYDNAHPHPDHPDEHHKHVFDPETWQEIRPPVWIGRDRWPHLSEVVAEVRDWWDARGRRQRLGEAAGGEPR